MSDMKNKIGPKSNPAKEYASNGQGNIRKYFNQLRLRLVIWLVVCFLIPHAVLSVYFHFQFTSTLKEMGKLNLKAIAESQKNTVDLFLQERVVNVFNLFHSREFTINPTHVQMAYYLRSLQQVSDAFIDVGFLSEEGIQIGYAGPFPDLQGRDYSSEKWFETLMKQEQGYYVSDIYMGFRNKPHFTIATRQLIDDKPYILRSTLDPDKFSLFLQSISREKGVESALINNSGFYQIVDPRRGTLLGKSEYLPPRTDAPGTVEILIKENLVVMAYAWLKETPWALVVRQPFSIVHAGMYRTRRIMITFQCFLLVSVGAVIWFTCNSFIKKTQSLALKRDELRSQLLHASKLASIGELSTGVAHEINNPLAIITATSGVIRDMFNPEFGLDSSPESVTRELDVIDAAAFRARKITRQLLDLGRKSTPRLVLCNVNDILDEVLSGVKEREFKVADIEVKREYDTALPQVLLDPDQIRQVLLNLINNAGDAISGPGIITITTSRNEKHILVAIADTGKGMDPEETSRIFDPFFTTKDPGKGTGLGLSVSMNIVESMGGHIGVQSVKGAGSSFLVSLPLHRIKGDWNG